jgi:uncharacterized phage protein gp47/JayE
MNYVVKYFNTITASMINYFAGIQNKITDFNVGSRIRTIFEATALEIETVYYQIYLGLQSSIDTAVYQSFNFPLLPSRNTVGVVRFSRAVPDPTVDYDIPAGTTVSTVATTTSPALSYQTISKVTLLHNTTSIDATVICLTTGLIGNVIANQITILSTAPTGIEAVTNANAFTTGQNTETSDQRKARFQQYIASLSKGTLPALEYGAKTVTGVIDAHAFESPLIHCFAYDLSITTFTDNSFEANMPSGVPFYAFPNPAGVGDCMYVGNVNKFASMRVDLSLGLVGNTVVWEYWNGSNWVTLTTTDDTSFLANDGLVRWTVPSNWVNNTVNGVNEFWVRLRITTNSISQIPKIFQIMLPPFAGIINVIVYDVSLTAPSALISAVLTALEDYRASGIKVTVIAPIVTYIDFDIVLRIDPQADAVTTKNNLAQAISDFLNGFTLDRDLILSELIQYIENSDVNIVETTMVTPAQDYFTGSNELLRAGTVTVTNV